MTMRVNQKTLSECLTSPLRSTYAINDIFNTPRITLFEARDVAAIVGQMRGVASEFEELRTLMKKKGSATIPDVLESIVDALGDALVFCDGIPYRLNLNVDDLDALYVHMDNYMLGSSEYVDLSLPGVDVSASFTDATNAAMSHPLRAPHIKTGFYFDSLLPENSQENSIMVHVSLFTWYKMRNLIVDMLSMLGVPVDRVIEAIKVSNESKLCATLNEAEMSIADYVSRGMPEDALAAEPNKECTAYIVRVIRDFSYVDGKGVLQDVFKGKFLKSILFREPNMAFIHGGA